MVFSKMGTKSATTHTQLSFLVHQDADKMAIRWNQSSNSCQVGNYMQAVCDNMEIYCDKIVAHVVT